MGVNWIAALLDMKVAIRPHEAFFQVPGSSISFPGRYLVHTPENNYFAI